MTKASYGASSRRPVHSGNRRVPGLYERTTSAGATVYEAGLRIHGRARRKVLDAKTKTDAIREVQRLKVDWERGDLHASSALTPTVRELAHDYVAHLQTRIGDADPKRRRSPRTVADTRYKLDRYVLPTLGGARVSELTVSDVLRLLDRLATTELKGRKGRVGLSPNARTGVISVLSGLLRFGVKRGVVERNVVRDLDRDDRPGTHRLTEPRYLDETELHTLLAKLSDTMRPVAMTCAFAGLRVSEALGLRWCDLDLGAGTLRIEYQLGPDGNLYPPKTAASRATVRVLPALARELVAHRQRQARRNIAFIRADALVFVTRSGRHQTARAGLRAVVAAGDATGLNGEGREPVGLHDLRHTLVALSLHHGLTLPEASSLARHANPRVTAQVYAGLTETARERVAEKLVEAGFGA